MSEYDFRDYDGASRETTKRRLRILQEYIKALTVKPNSPAEVLAAVGFDLIYVGERHGGNLSQAAAPSGRRSARSRGRDEDAPS